MGSIPLVIVGGFLGAGKTTLLWETARRLMARGKRVGLITNDQAPHLVDTGLLATQGMDVREVAGSCFCCNFPALLEAAGALKNRLDADILIAEPVGSCTDLAATIMQPLRDRYTADFALARLSVLADPARIGAVLSDGRADLHPSAAYIVRKQLEEADLIVVNKADLLGPADTASFTAQLEAAFPGTELRFVSALEGRGIDEWLESACNGEPAGQRLLQIDYDTYAEGEAVLGWLNADVELSAIGGPVDWRGLCADLMRLLREQFQRRNAAVGHVKVLLLSDAGTLIANLTRARGDVVLRGDLSGTPSSAGLVVNARVEMAPDDLASVVHAAISATAGNVVRSRVKALRSLRPGRPRPTYRYAQAI